MKSLLYLVLLAVSFAPMVVLLSGCDTTPRAGSSAPRSSLSIRSRARQGFKEIQNINQLSASGQYAAALQQILERWRDRDDRGDGYGLQHGQLLKSLAQLAEVYPPARESFDQLLGGAAKPGDDPTRHRQLADAYAGAGRYPEALTEYLWCLDHRSGDRAAQVLAIVGLGRLAPNYPPAQAAFDRFARTEWQATDNPMAHQYLGEAYVIQEKYPEALREFLWCWDEGAATPAYSSVRRTFLLRAIVNLGKRYPPALEALELRREGRGPVPKYDERRNRPPYPNSRNGSAPIAIGNEWVNPGAQDEPPGYAGGDTPLPWRSPADDRARDVEAIDRALPRTH